MLRELSIKNFAIIDDLRIAFSDGLTVLSGETGAGKSILINAVNLLLGARAAAGLVRTGHDSAELEALFKIQPDGKVAKTLEAFGYEASEDLIIRRIISQTDRHRVYINGRLCTLSMLNAVTENLASISGQHAYQKLLNEEQHLLILDQFGQLTPLREAVYHRYHELVPLIRKVDDLKAEKSRQEERIRILEFQKSEILEASPVVGEDAVLEQDLTRLKHSERLYQTVWQIVEELYGAQNAVAERLSHVRKRLEKASQLDSGLTPAAGRVGDVLIQIEELTADLRTYLNTVAYDDKQMEAIEARIHILQRLKRKYGAGTLDGVFSHLEAIHRELASIANISDQINETEAALSELHTELAQQAAALSERRKEAAAILSRKVEEELASLKMSHTTFEALVEPVLSNDHTPPYLMMNHQAITETGVDKVRFLIAPNVGEALKPLSAIASGGELSRVVLAIKVILSETDAVSTVVFDEVDSGIGGGVAEVVGRKLAALAAFHQVICITHLAQIAKFADRHFKISKQIADNRTRTVIEALDGDSRIGEIARMIGGETITQTTLDHAAEMLSDSNPSNRTIPALDCSTSATP